LAFVLQIGDVSENTHILIYMFLVPLVGSILSIYFKHCHVFGSLMFTLINSVIYEL